MEGIKIERDKSLDGASPVLRKIIRLKEQQKPARKPPDYRGSGVMSRQAGERITGLSAKGCDSLVKRTLNPRQNSPIVRS